MLYKIFQGSRNRFIYTYRPPELNEKEEVKPALPPKRLRSKTPSTPPLSPKLEEFTAESEVTRTEPSFVTNNESEKPCSNSSNNNDNEIKHQEIEEVVLRRKSKVRTVGIILYGLTLGNLTHYSTYKFTFSGNTRPNGGGRR